MRLTRICRFGSGRCNGVALCRTVVLPQSRVLAVAFAVAFGFVVVLAPVPSGAQSTTDQIARTRAEIDATAQRWFASREASAKLDSDVAMLERQVRDTRAQVDWTAAMARERAVQLYMGAGIQLAPLLASDSALDAARHAELLDRANSQSERTIDDLEVVTERLSEQRETLAKRRAEQATLEDRLAGEQAELERQLGLLQAQAQREAELRMKAALEQAAAAARLEAQAQRAGPPPAPAATSASASAAAAAPKPPPPPKRAPAPPPRPVPIPAPPPPSNGMNPHHNDPFLVCTRGIESHGNYSVVSASGKYYGAYQFSPTTWDVTASHAGRPELIGVLPSRASVYDQDDLAWTLYQWQGKAPWNGRC
jgi:septal ring factor EnvC (AmiA/AmiB activator)